MQSPSISGDFVAALGYYDNRERFAIERVCNAIWPLPTLMSASRATWTLTLIGLRASTRERAARRWNRKRRRR